MLLGKSSLSRYDERVERRSFQKLLIFFGVAAVFSALAIAALFFLLENPSQAEDANSSMGAPDTGVSISLPEPRSDIPTIIYTGEAFHPDRLFLDGQSAGGCVVLLMNNSAGALAIGLDPHRAEGDAGPQYQAIAPGGTLIFDPRFPGISELRFHSHARPGETFSLVLASGCQI